MAPGDVVVQIVAANTTNLDTIITGMRTGANDKWLMCYAGEGQICVVNIEEA